MTDPYVACFGRKMLEEDRGSHGFDELVATCKAPEVFMGIKLQPNMEKWLQEDLHARTVCFVGSDGSTHPVHPYLMGFLKLPKQEGGSILTLKENANGLILKTFILRIYGSLSSRRNSCLWTMTNYSALLLWLKNMRMSN